MLNITDIHDIMILSDTLYLKNKSQARILLELAKARNEDRSLTSYSLNKDHGIPLSTWQDNYSYLEENQLIKPDKKNRIILRKKQGSKKKTSRPKFPYIITHLGIFCLLKSLTAETHEMIFKDPLLGWDKYIEFKNEDLNMLLSFLPIFSNYRNELQKMFEYDGFPGILFHILRYTLKNIGFNSFSEGRGSLDNIVDYYEIVLQNDAEDTVKISRDFNLSVKDYDDQEITIFHRVTFLFFYNLFRLIKGDPQLLDIACSDSTLPLLNSIKLSDMKTEEEKDDYFFKRIRKRNKMIIDLVSKNESKLSRLVEKDSDLPQIMEYHFKEINYALNNKRTFEKIQSIFHMK